MSIFFGNHFNIHMSLYFFLNETVVWINRFYVRTTTTTIDFDNSSFLL